MLVRINNVKVRQDMTTPSKAVLATLTAKR
jgi:hypothetical protein